VKISLKIFITLIVVALFVSQVNSVYKFEKKNKIFFYENKKVCEKSWIDISWIMKDKHIQEMSLSCEISATADILSFLMSKKVTEKELLEKLPKSQYNKFPEISTSIIKWWDPETGYVWYIDKLPNGKKARQRMMTGYWVLEKPIEKIINEYWFQTEIINKNDYYDNFWEKEHLTLLLQNLKKWNMVQLWWDICTNPKDYSWKEHRCFYNWEPSWNKKRKITWEYKDKNWNIVKYNWLNWEHAFYLLWFIWDINNPKRIIVWDTFTGKHTYPTKEWLRKWRKMQYRSILIYAK